MMAQFKKHLLLLVTIFCFTNLVHAQSYSSVEEFISEQKQIRVLIDPTPNYGNQTASINVMKRLREFGFKGSFEIVYNDTTIPDGSLKKKVITLLSLPNTIPDDYSVDHPQLGQIHLLNTSVLIESMALGNKPTKIILTVDGGDDFQGHELEEMLLSEVATTVYAKIGPYVQYPSAIKHVSWNEFKELPESKNKFYSMQVYSLDDAIQFLNEDSEGKKLSQTKPALNLLIDGMKSHQFYMMPMYGTTIRSGTYKNEQGKIMYGHEELHKMLRIIAGVRYAQQHDQSLSEKPIILTVFYDYKPEMQMLSQFLQSDHWGEYERPGSETARKVLKELDIKNVLQFASLSDADALSRIQNLKPGQILLLSMEPLPKVVFDGIFNHADQNILPAIREGANTLNTLILNGKPHFRCGDGRNVWELGYDYLMTDSQFKNRFSEVTQNLCIQDEDTASWSDLKSTWITHENLYRQYGEMILESRKSDSAISLYFLNLKNDVTKPENDRIRYVLTEILKTF